jgi:predicted ribosome quality control (RQC) complex YloA/Tae2 family protein
VHLNYYFLRQLSDHLRQRLAGFEVATCFSQEKDELVIGFIKGQEEFYLKAILASQFTSLAFPESFNRARTNSVNLFESIIGATVTDLVQHEHERSFALYLTGELVLLFKLFGNRSNLILFHQSEPVELFHRKLSQDLLLRPDRMSRELQQDYSAFLRAGTDLRQLFPTFGDLPLRYLQEKGYYDLPSEQPEQKWSLVQELLAQLASPSLYYLIQIGGQNRLSLLPLGTVRETFREPVAALRAFVATYLREHHFAVTYRQVHQHLQQELENSIKIQAQATQKLRELQQDFSYSQTADLIMANLTFIPPQAEQVEVFDFYTEKNRIIRLKPSETPQKQAERLYRKAKNRQIELNRMEERIFKKEVQIQEAQAKLDQLQKITDLKLLKAFLKEHPELLQDRQQKEKEQLFREFSYQGFKILIGKSARNNDLLTQKHSYKDDLWLHAKDVSGSHVLVKYIAGRNFPEQVVEAAAQLAAYYSKRKSDTLCPVTYTPKKYVRKPKGAEPGAVVVEREKVILVEPRNPFEQTH